MPTKHPSVTELSVSQAAEYLARRPRKLEQFLDSLEADHRIGMQNLARRARVQRRSERAERSRITRMLKHERRLWGKGICHVAGVDEVGRGPLAGPVVAAAVILPQDARIPRLDDSKALKPADREELFDEIRALAVAVSLGSVSPEEVDRINIYQATLETMRQAIRGLPVPPDRILVDGNVLPESGFSELAIIGGDAASQSIAAASVIAKVTRDRQMCEHDAEYPVYGFARHKGYASEAHTKALMAHGPCPIHRRSFCTVEEALSTWSTAFRDVCATVDSIKKSSELAAYHTRVHRSLEKLSVEELSEINRRISRRSNQLQSPDIV